jgi:ATP-dependent DNA helicase Q1
MGLAALGIPAYMLTSTTNKVVEKFIYKALDKGEGELKILYVTPEKISTSKRFMSKLEKCHHADRLSLIAIDVSNYKLVSVCQQWPQLLMTFTYPGLLKRGPFCHLL